MKIGIFTDSYLPTPTGVAVSVETFRKSLEAAGHEVYIFAPRFKNHKDTNPHVTRYASIFLPVRKDAPIVWPILRPDYPAFKKLELDIVHTMHFFTIGTLGLKVAKRLKIPLVHTYHTLYAEYVKDYVPLIPGLARSYMITRSRNYCNQCNLVIAPSPSMGREVKSYGVTVPIKALPTGIDPDAFRSIAPNELRHKYKIRPEGKLILFVGRLGEEKNIKFLIDAFNKVQEQIDSNLILVGSGPSIEDYKKQVNDLGLNEKVYFLGFLPKPETNQIFGACDTFAFASVTDTQGIVLVEAMAAGTPPVAINKLGPGDIITDGKDGLLTDLNLEHFVAKIVQLLEDDNLRKKLSEVAKKTAQEYAQPKIVEKLITLYENVRDKSITS